MNRDLPALQTPESPDGRPSCVRRWSSRYQEARRAGNCAGTAHCGGGTTLRGGRKDSKVLAPGEKPLAASYALTKVLELRDSRSRPRNGIVIFAHRAFNQHEVLVASCKRSALMLRKPPV